MTNIYVKIKYLPNTLVRELYWQNTFNYPPPKTKYRNPRVNIYKPTSPNILFNEKQSPTYTSLEVQH